MVMATEKYATECLVNDSSVVLMFFGSGVSDCLCVCVCVCVRGRRGREKAMLSSVMYWMIMEAYGVCAFIKLLGMLMGFQLV